MSQEMLASFKVIIRARYLNHEIDVDTYAALTEDVKLAEMRLSR